METDESRGLTFARQQLLRHGWNEGKGLGRDENGICEAIKVKVKCDKGGVGHKESEQFTFHWWDHVFNKASASLAVESVQDGVLVKKMEGAEEEEGVISNRKPRKAMLNKSVLYGSFVKSSTLLSGQELPVGRTSCSEDSSSSEDDEKLDLSSTTKLSDTQLIKACGGRTAHKGARHGLTMKAKLARLEQQEQEFMARYGPTSGGSAPRESHPATPSSAPAQALAEKTKRKKAKKNKEQASDEPCEGGGHLLHTPHEDEGASRRRKKRSKQDVEMNHTQIPKEKKRRKHLEKITEPGEVQNGKKTAAAEPQEGAAPSQDGEGVPKKKRKTKHLEQMAEEALKENCVVVSECCVQAPQVEGSVVLHPTHDHVSKKNKKKSRKSGQAEAAELDVLHSWESSSTDTKRTENVEKDKSEEKKKKKKNKQK
ncbi:G patch domain-containing protein 4 [Brachyhypopomus gauderio]|uniref:G patch domain-containing protein 4 n=1 Tax=Brachyhypopomus gauderio TaxID=698409 RepID=UPI0040432E81